MRSFDNAFTADMAPGLITLSNDRWNTFDHDHNVMAVMLRHHPCRHRRAEEPENRWQVK
jgi:hypothetical protein